jgi:hypothetical protein
MICGFLGANGIDATYDKGGVLGPLFPAGAPGLLGNSGWAVGAVGLGRQEILVRAEDAERAQELLAHVPR